MIRPLIPALILLAGGVSAQPTPFSVHDRNADGLLDRHEYAGLVAELRDKALSQPPRTQRFRAPPAFRQLDRNGDNLISEDEMWQWLQQRRNRHGQSR